MVSCVVSETKVKLKRMWKWKKSGGNRDSLRSMLVSGTNEGGPLPKKKKKKRSQTRNNKKKKEKRTTSSIIHSRMNKTSSLLLLATVSISVVVVAVVHQTQVEERAVGPSTLNTQLSLLFLTFFLTRD
jgi:hypothetical protein